MKKIKIKRISYPNGEILKIENRRVIIQETPEGEFLIQFRILSDEHSPRAVHVVERGKIVITQIKMSSESAFVLLQGLQFQINKQKINKNEI